MKKILLAAAVIVMASCSGRTTSLTVYLGEAADMDSVTVDLGEDFTITVPVVDGIASCDVPADVTKPAMVSAGEGKAYFLSDGSEVLLDLSGETPVLGAGASEGNVRVAEFNHGVNEMTALLEGIQARLLEGADRNSPEIQEAIGEYYDFSDSLYLAGYRNNKDNFIAAATFPTLAHEMSDNEILEEVATLSAAIRNDEAIARVVEGVEKRSSTTEGKMFTDFEIAQEDGKIVKFSDFIGKGKYVLVDFWASWCGPCRAEIPNIKAVYEKYKGESFDVLGVAVWDKEEKSREAMRELGIVWDVILNAQKVPTDIYGIEGIPQIMLFGPDGVILKRNLRGDAIETAVAEALSAQ